MNKPIVRIIGGPECKLAYEADLLQVPYTLEGMSMLTNLHDADVVVYWPDSGLLDTGKVLQQLRDAAEQLKDDKVAVIWGLPVLTDDKRFTNRATGKLSKPTRVPFLQAGSNNDSPFAGIAGLINNQIAFIGRHGVDPATWGKDAYRRETGCDDISDFVRDAICHVMADAWVAAKHGAVVFAVIPTQFVQYVYDWISPHISIGKNRDKKSEQNAMTDASCSERFIQAVSYHGRTIVRHDMTIGLDFAEPVDEGRIVYKGFYTLKVLTDTPSLGKSKVHVCPGMQNAREQAHTLVLRCGAGGVILMPEPRNIRELLEVIISSLIPMSQANVTEAPTLVGVDKTASLSSASERPLRDLIPFRHGLVLRRGKIKSLPRLADDIDKAKTVSDLQSKYYPSIEHLERTMRRYKENHATLADFCDEAIRRLSLLQKVKS